MDFEYSFVITAIPDEDVAKAIADRIGDILQHEFSTYVYITPEEI